MVFGTGGIPRRARERTRAPPRAVPGPGSRSPRAALSTPLKVLPFHAVDDDTYYLVDIIVEVKLDKWHGRRGRYVLFKIYYIGYDHPEWSLLELLDDTHTAYGSGKYVAFKPVRYYLDLGNY